MSTNNAVTKSDILNKLFSDYGLIYDSKNPNSKENDIFVHKFYKIITRSGIEKIQKKANIEIKYKPVLFTENFAALHCIGTRFDEKGQEIAQVETFASANGNNSPNDYYPEIAEKRGMSRIVLKLAGLYEYGVYGADEMPSKKGSAREAEFKEEA